MPSLKIFQIAKIGPIVLIFDNKDVSDFNECKVIIVNDSVTIIDLSWHNIAHLVHELINVHFQALQHSHAYLSASMICLVRDKEEEEEEEEDLNADLYDDQVLDFHEFVHVCWNDRVLFLYLLFMKFMSYESCDACRCAKKKKLREI